MVDNPEEATKHFGSVACNTLCLTFLRFVSDHVVHRMWNERVQRQFLAAALKEDADCEIVPLIREHITLLSPFSQKALKLILLHLQRYSDEFLYLA